MNEPTSNSGSVSHWIQDAKELNPEAIETLFHRYWGVLVEAVRRRMGRLPVPGTEDEDIALSAFNSLFARANSTQIPRLTDRDDLWKLLLTFAYRKISYHARSARAAKRSPKISECHASRPRIRSLSHMPEILSTEPSPDMVAATKESVEVLIASLRDDDLQTIAIRKLEGLDAREIAAELGCSVRTVQRRLEIIQFKWQEMIPV